MYWFDWLTRKGRARRRTEKLINENTRIPVDVNTMLTCIRGLQAVLNDPRYRANAEAVSMEMHFTPEALLASIREHRELLLNGGTPARRRYPIKPTERLFTEWFWTDNEEPMDVYAYMEELLMYVNSFVLLLGDDYERSGKGVAGYRLEQMYYQLCDIITLTEAFYCKE